MKKIFCALTLSAMVFAACVPLDTPPYDRETDLTFWQDDPGAAYDALNTCYTYLTDMYELVYSDGMTDNAYVKGGQNQAIGNGKYGTSDGYVYDVWNRHYAGIRACNELLAHIDLVPDLAADLKARYIAEARVLRAWNYYELYVHFGGVPYVTTPISIAESRILTRESAETVASNIENELQEVIDGNALPGSYSGTDQGRVTKWTARAIQARTYLFEGNYQKVRDITQDIMDNSGIELYPSYSGLFEVSAEQCPEIMLANQYIPISREHNIMYNTIPPSMGGYSNLAPLKSLVDSYIMLNGKAIDEAGSGYDASNPWAGRDPRLAATVMYPGNSYPGTAGAIEPDWTGRDAFGSTSDVTPTGYYIRKWWDNTYRQTLQSGLNAIIIRYADVLLMNAEAHAELGTLNETVWNATIRKIRERAGFTEAGALDFPATGSDLKAIVRNERRSELAFEGTRRNDIIRWKTAETVLNGWCHGLYTGETVGTDDGFVRVEERQFDPAKHYLWPIPQKERDLTNNILEQNPNW